MVMKKCNVPMNNWCNGKNKKRVQLRTRAAGVHGTNLYDGEVVEMCEECRKAHCGGFKIVKN